MAWVTHMFVTTLALHVKSGAAAETQPTQNRPPSKTDVIHYIYIYSRNALWGTEASLLTTPITLYGFGLRPPPPFSDGGFGLQLKAEGQKSHFYCKKMQI